MSDDLVVAPIGTPTETLPVSTEHSWLLSLPEDLQNDPTLNNFKSVEDAARGFIETKRMVGDRVKIPDDNTPQEERDKFFAKIGRPETVEGYELSKIDLPPAMQIDEGAVQSFKKTAFELGLSKKQADGIYTSYLNTQKEMSAKLLSDYEAGVTQQVEVLKDRWGDNFESNRNLAVNAFNHFASPTLKATVEREGWGNNPDFIELFQKIGVATSEDVMRSGGQVHYTNLDDSIKEIDRKIMSMDQGDPEYRTTLEKRRLLYEERWKERPE